jgi:putative transcriptional regulator
MEQQRPHRPVLPKVATPARGTINARAIRLRTRGDLGLTQQAFANAIGVPVKTLRNWEQGRRQPTGPARVLLSLIERNPWVVHDLTDASGVIITEAD